MSQAVAYSADVVELVYTRDLKSLAFSMAYEFESHRPHQSVTLKIQRLTVALWNTSKSIAIYDYSSLYGQTYTNVRLSAQRHETRWHGGGVIYGHYSPRWVKPLSFL